MTKGTMASRQKTKSTKISLIRQRMTVKIIAVSVIIIIIVGLVTAYYGLPKSQQNMSDLMPIRIVKITGNLKHISRQQIISQLQKAPLVNTEHPCMMLKGDPCLTDYQPQPIDPTEVIGFFGSDLQWFEQQLKTLPWIQTVTLRRVWPDRLHVAIKEHRAIARWNDNSLINEYGVVFTPKSLNGFEPLPQLRGADQDLSRMLQTFRQLQQLLEAADLQLKALNLNHRYAWSLKLLNGIQLEVGRKNLVERVERFIALYPLLQRESDLPIAKIDLRYDTGLAVTRREVLQQQASL